MNRVASVYVFTNGAAMVFDDNHQQIPELQGQWSEMEPIINEAMDQDSKLYTHLNYELLRRKIINDART